MQAIGGKSLALPMPADLVSHTTARQQMQWRRTSIIQAWSEAGVRCAALSITLPPAARKRILRCGWCGGNSQPGHPRPIPAAGAAQRGSGNAFCSPVAILPGHGQQDALAGLRVHPAGAGAVLPGKGPREEAVGQAVVLDLRSSEGGVARASAVSQRWRWCRRRHQRITAPCPGCRLTNDFLAATATPPSGVTMTWGLQGEGEGSRGSMRWVDNHPHSPGASAVWGSATAVPLQCSGRAAGLRRRSLGGHGEGLIELRRHLAPVAGQAAGDRVVNFIGCRQGRCAW